MASTVPGVRHDPLKAALALPCRLVIALDDTGELACRAAIPVGESRS
jgi:hypothetical protein